MNLETTFIDIKTKSYLERNWNEAQRIIDVTPDHDRELALIDLSFIIRLTEVLPKGDLYEIKKGLKANIVNARCIEAIVKACEDFIEFHRTIDLIQKVNVDRNEFKHILTADSNDMLQPKKNECIEEL